jgi:hypothetical protein
LLRDGLPCHLASLVRALLLVTCTFGPAALALAQGDDQPYARKNSFGVVTAYSPDSSHMFLGYAQKRELVDIGISYSRRLLLNHLMNWQFDAEFLPVALNSDPVQVTTSTFTFSPPASLTTTETMPTETACQPSSGSGTFPNGTTYTYVSTCNRRWVPGQALSPLGLQWNFLPHHKLQPIFGGHVGYMYSAQPIPTAQAGSFNFTFDVGVGFEFFRTHSHSYRVEYRYHHISNDETADDNPGIDNGVVQISWLFGR